MKPVIHTETEPEIVSRITDLLISQKKKQSELMDYLGLHRNNFSEWKAGRNRSYLIYIDEIARYFEVSPTYLLRGVEDKDIINGSEEAQGIKNIEYNLADKVRELRAYLRLSRAVFAEPLGLSPTHFARFETGESIPTEGTITSICEAFGVDPRYFAADGHMAVEEAADFIDHSELIPDRLRSAREAKGWSQRELERRSGVHVSIINRVESSAKLTMKPAAIAKLRKFLRLSQAAFAEPLGLSPTHIARFEKGVSIPSAETITSICKAFGVDPVYFAAGGDIAIEDAVVFADQSKLSTVWSLRR